MDPLSAIGAAGGQIFSSVWNARSAEDINRQQIAFGRETNAFNAAEAAKSRDWEGAQAQNQMNFQERMSSTAHTREIDDLKNAGLNPILSAAQSGASSPSGAMGSSSPASGVGVPGLKTPMINLDFLPMFQLANEMQKTNASVNQSNAMADYYRGLGPREEKYYGQLGSESKDRMNQNTWDKIKGELMRKMYESIKSSPKINQHRDKIIDNITQPMPGTP